MNNYPRPDGTGRIIPVENVAGIPGSVELDAPYNDGPKGVRVSMYTDNDFGGHTYLRLNIKEVSDLIDALTAVKSEMIEKNTLRELRGF